MDYQNVHVLQSTAIFIDVHITIQYAEHSLTCIMLHVSLINRYNTTIPFISY